MITIPMRAEAIRLEKRALFEVADAAGVEFACSEGLLWITLDHDTRDIILGPGESFLATAHRRGLVYALEASRFTVRLAVEEEEAEETTPRWSERVVAA